EVVLPDGEIVKLGGRNLSNPGYDLLGLLLGSEGTLGIVTKVLAKIVRKPKHVRTYLASFDSVDSASNAVSAIISSGMIPAALEMMDSLAIHAVESSIHSSGYPRDVGSVLIVEVDGEGEELEVVSPTIMNVCRENGAREVKEASSEEERTKWWKGRKGAFGAMGKISPSYYVQDGVIPRNKLPVLMKKIEEVSKSYSLRIANVFHAGDGNLHPLILYDEKVPEEVRKVIKAGEEILMECIEVGGSITGEHGIGIEKKAMMTELYSAEDLDAMLKIRAVFNPRNLCNPGKIFPSSGACASGTSGQVQEGSW
ncbi:MAG: FAD-linked oxidase C-terminal domain-containing protein, partial [Nitrososphaerales archaeon]